jgi:cytochrome c-type biogenesis protein CcmH
LVVVTTTFWSVAALLCALAVAILFVPVWRQKSRDGRWSPAGIVAIVLIAPLALGLYAYVSNWDPEYAARTNRETELLEQLASHLESNPADLQGWRLLAASYMQLGRYDEGRAAYQRLWALTREPDDELKLAYAESQILSDRATLTGEAGRLVEEVLAARPSDAKALWYGGLVALESGREDAVRTRWTSLLAMNPPEDVERVVRSQLAALTGVNAEGAAGTTAEVSGPEIKLSVTLGAGRSLESLGPDAQLYILARAPEGGPPLAVMRRPASAVPGEFSLSDANSMIPGRSLATYPEITVVARLSRSGQPTAQPGDWQAEAVVRPSEGATLALVIDQVVQ